MFLFYLQDQLKTISKHYLKLIDSKPNIVAGTSYANLKEYLLKIEKSGYLDHIVKKSDKEVSILFYHSYLKNRVLIRWVNDISWYG